MPQFIFGQDLTTISRLWLRMAEHETDSFERIQSSPSPLVGDPDPVQSGLVRTVQIFVNSFKCMHILILLLTSYVNMSVDFAARNPPKRYS